MGITGLSIRSLKQRSRLDGVRVVLTRSNENDLPGIRVASAFHIGVIFEQQVCEKMITATVRSGVIQQSTRSCAG
jgi:hypothetical protein